MKYNNLFDYADWLEGTKDLDVSSANLERKIFVETSSEDFKVNPGATDFSKTSLYNVLVGRNTYKLDSGMISSNLVIGRYCSISHFVNMGSTHHNYNNLSTSFGNEDVIDDTFTIVGCDVWIGVSATILGGAEIGHGAVIGAGAIIKKEIPPYAIVVGNKAEVIKMRFSDEIISDLLELKWWTLPHETIMQLPVKNIKECVNKLKEIRKYNDVNVL